MNESQLAPEIRGALGGLKARIRAYVLLEGVALGVAWIGLTFWLGLGMDYLPVVIFAQELPWIARAAMLACIALVLLFIVYRYILRRMFVQIANRSLALLLERSDSRLSDSLVTSVEMADSPAHAEEFNRAMLAQTRADAAQEIRQTRLSDVFDFKPLLLSSIAAVFFIAITAMFVAANTDAFNIWVKRLYLLSNEQWPRQVNLSYVGVEIRQDEDTPADIIPLTAGEPLKVPSGANLIVHVHADTTKPRAESLGSSTDSAAKTSKVVDRMVPDACVIYTTTQLRGNPAGKSWASELLDRLGLSGPEIEVDRKTMQKTTKAVVEGKQIQRYRYEGRPFSGLNSAEVEEVTFRVQGYDHGVSGYKLIVVPTPTIDGKSTMIVQKLPAYFESFVIGSMTPTALYGPRMSLPIGTDVSVETAANKPLKSAKVWWVEEEKELEAEIYGEANDQLRFSVGKIQQNITLEITLLDQDGLRSETPSVLELFAEKDAPPQVQMVLSGIGEKVTPNVRIPIQGEITDDKAPAEAWFEIVVNDDPAEQFPIRLGSGKAVAAVIDFQELGQPPRSTESDESPSDGQSNSPKLRKDDGGAPDVEPPDVEPPVAGDEPNNAEPRLKLVAGQKLHVSVQAKDFYDLGLDNIGAGDVYQLDVVTPDDLLSHLERREVSLRRDLEKAIAEVIKMRNDLVDAGLGISGGSLSPTSGSSDAGKEPEDTIREPGDKPIDQSDVDNEGEELTEASRRNYTVQRSMNQSMTSRDTILRLSEDFLNIREQLINNRVDSTDRQERLQKMVYAPLQATANKSFDRLDDRFAALKSKLDRSADYAATGQAAVDQTDKIILELTAVLDKLMKIETYNELLELVRGLQEDHEEVIDLTRKKQREEALRGALD